jgi:hypothetical protein
MRWKKTLSVLKYYTTLTFRTIADSCSDTESRFLDVSKVLLCTLNGGGLYLPGYTCPLWRWWSYSPLMRGTQSPTRVGTPEPRSEAPFPMCLPSVHTTPLMVFGS